MNVHLIANEISTATTTTGTSYSMIDAMKDNNNRNNIGTAQVVSAGAGILKIQGSADGGNNWIDLATGLNSSTGKTLALMPYLRAVVTTAGAGGTTASVYVVQ
jgi:hypothetical protein